MNKILCSLLLTIGLIHFTHAQNTRPLFEPPHTPPAIFMSSMPPCIVGVALQYGEDIGLSAECLNLSKEYLSEAMEKVPNYIQRVRTLELKVMKASQNEDYERYEKLLNQLSALKIEASLFHEELVKKARQSMPAKDISKIDAFIRENHEEFLKTVKLQSN